MTKLLSIKNNYFLFVLFSLSFFFGNSQNTDDNYLFDSYKNYAQLPRETAYLHLNKSIYIKGECIGFSAYVLDKNTKKTSSLTTNLYCTITDKNNVVIKSQMIKVSDGYAIGTFDVNEDFLSGDYTIMAYTNWMKNFDEQNIFVESIRVIDPDTDNIIKSNTIENVIDAQFLPEGGHLVADIQSTLGVIVKNAEGFGVSEVQGEILDSENSVITTFKTNTLGIGRTLITPKKGQTYKSLTFFNT